MTSNCEPSPQHFSYEVEPEEAGKRLDAFLSHHIPDVSRALVRRGIDNQLATVDGKQCKASYRLRSLQRIEFTLPPPPAKGPEPEPIPLSLLYEDEVIVVVDKPAGMVVHPAKGHWSGTLASALVHHFGQSQLSEVGGATRPGIVHRLDRDTSGVLIVAKTDVAHRHLADQFKARTTDKEYLVLVAGNPDRDRDLIDHPIGAHPSQREKKALRSGHATSREAQTFYEVEERFGGIALLRAKPRTGRTHQIRLHLVSTGCAVLCDRLYGGRSQLTAGELRHLLRNKRLAAECADDVVLLDRQALHAHRLCLTHPTTGKEMNFVAELPADMQQLLNHLQQKGERSA